MGKTIRFNLFILLASFSSLTTFAQSFIFDLDNDLVDFAQMELQSAEAPYSEIYDVRVELLGEVFDNGTKVEEIIVDYFDREQNRSIEFIVNQDTVQNECGSLIYEGVEKVDPGVDYFEGSTPNRTIRLVDHRTRRCRDFKKFQWEAFVSSPQAEDGQNPPFPELVLAGNPQ